LILFLKTKPQTSFSLVKGINLIVHILPFSNQYPVFSHSTTNAAPEHKIGLNADDLQAKYLPLLLRRKHI